MAYHHSNMSHMAFLALSVFVFGLSSALVLILCFWTRYMVCMHRLCNHDVMWLAEHSSILSQLPYNDFVLGFIRR
jgi:hypothetical protein